MQKDQNPPDWPGVWQGIFGDTLLATPDGFCAAGRLSAGSEVITAGGKTVRLAAVQTRFVPRDLAWRQWPVLVPAYTFSTTAALVLPPGQPLLLPRMANIRTDGAAVQSHALEGWNGITRAVPAPGAVVVNLLFERSAAVQSHQNLWLAFPDTLGAYSPPVFSLATAKGLLARMLAAQVGRALVIARNEGQAAMRAPPPKRA